MTVPSSPAKHSAGPAPARSLRMGAALAFTLVAALALGCKPNTDAPAPQQASPAAAAPAAEPVQWTGRTADGWLGEKSTLVVRPAYGKPVALSITLPPQVLPATVRLTRDGQPLRELNVTGPDAVVVDAGPAPTKDTTIGIEVSRSFVPKELGMGDDIRKLAARAELVQPRLTQWKGRFDDGWVGEHSELVLFPGFGKPAVVSLRVAGENLPATVRVTRNGQPFKELNVTSSDELRVEVPSTPAETTVVGIDVSRSFVPKELSKKSLDTRKLSAVVALTDAAPAAAPATAAAPAAPVK